MFGIEKTPATVAEAKLNAERNGITNCEFVCGELKDQLDGLIQRIETGAKKLVAENRKIVAIVDPRKAKLGTFYILLHGLKTI